MKHSKEHELAYYVWEHQSEPVQYFCLKHGAPKFHPDDVGVIYTNGLNSSDHFVCAQCGELIVGPVRNEDGEVIQTEEAARDARMQNWLNKSEALANELDSLNTTLVHTMRTAANALDALWQVIADDLSKKGGAQ